MNLLRSALYVFLLVAIVVPWSFVVCSSVLVDKPKRYWLAQRYTGLAIFLGRAICGMRYRVEGRENLPDGPAIVMCKHQSAWETLWVQANMPRRMAFVYKRELHVLPFFGWAMAALGMISIDRSRGQDAFEQVVTQGTEHLRDGWWIMMFPEGTRTPPGSTKRYKTGGARLAVRTGARIIPIAVNSGECWPRNSFVKKPGQITVSILPVIDPAGKTADEVGAAVESAIETEMRRLAPHRYAGPYVPATAN
jgi:1-acyl-sn-glycerol-3-phosphate acyltransferase